MAGHLPLGVQSSRGAEPPRAARRTPRGGAGAGVELRHCRGDARERAAALLVIVRVEDTMANRAVEGGVVLHQYYVEHLVRLRLRVSTISSNCKPYVLQAATAGAAGCTASHKLCVVHHRPQQPAP